MPGRWAITWLWLTLAMVGLSGPSTAAANNLAQWLIQPGIYASTEFDNQGLILARQGNAVALYPLIYDEDGNSRWYWQDI